MQYHSLNNQKLIKTFGEAVIQGQASDGGLFYPSEIPIEEGYDRYNDLASLATALLSPMTSPEINPMRLAQICKEAFNFPIPLIELTPNLWVLELFHGPTAAFKDVGARFLSRVFSTLTTTQLTVLVATSGDTGGAVAHGFHGVEGIDVVILYPKGRVSPLQEKQLTTLGGNITALEVEGSFDDCQRMVKAMLRDEEVHQKRKLTSANSINLARWLPQSMYYAWAAQQLKTAPYFVVPSGNFGNLAAGIFAERRGIKISGFLAATNRNDAFHSYLKTGRFEAKSSVLTPSNAMDVGDPSNRPRVEALFADDFGRMKGSLSSDSVGDQETIDAMREVYEKYGYILCPHTAVGYAALKRSRSDQVPKVLLSTAHPAKFSSIVASAIGVIPKRPPSLECLTDQREKIYVSIPANVQSLKDFLLA